MKKLHIDFTGRGQRSPWAGRALLALALGVALHTVLSYERAKGELAQMRAQAAQASDRPAVPARKVAPEELAAVRETVERLGLPWERLFNALEAAAGDDVALLGIEPDPKAGTVLISGDSRNYLATLSYVLNLSRGDGLDRVQLVRHDVKAQEPHAPVGFAVSAVWKGARP